MAATAASPSRAMRMNRRMLRMPSANSLAATTRQPARGSRAGVGGATTATSGGAAMVHLILGEVAHVDLVQVVPDAPELPHAHAPGGQVAGQTAPDALGPGHPPELRVARITHGRLHAGDGQ